MGNVKENKSEEQGKNARSAEEQKKELVYFRFPSTETSPFEQFVLFLYLWAAYSDFEIRALEKDMIQTKMEENGMISPIAFENQWQKAWDDFKSRNDYECEQYIEQTCKSLNLAQEARQKIFDDIKDIMNIGRTEVSSGSVNLFKFKKMLKL